MASTHSADDTRISSRYAARPGTASHVVVRA